MATTSISLLDRLKAARPDSSDWGRLRDLYAPLIRAWLARVPGLSDVDDLSQEVLLVVVREIAGFERQREGSFRAWLRKVTVNKVRTHRRRRHPRLISGADPAEGFLEQLADPASDLSREWDREHDRHVAATLLAIVRPDFSEATWDAFLRFGMQGTPAAAVARELGLTENAVLLAKSRVLKRLREEAGGFLE